MSYRGCRAKGSQNIRKLKQKTCVIPIYRQMQNQTVTGKMEKNPRRTDHQKCAKLEECANSESQASSKQTANEN